MAGENVDTTYKRTSLQKTEDFEIVSIEWTQTSLSPMHHHAGSQCLVLVQEGVFENTLDLGSKKEVQVLEVGQVLNTPLEAHHSMRCLSATGKTLHIYTPRIKDESIPSRFKAGSLDLQRKNLKLAEPTRLDILRRDLREIRDQSLSTNSVYFMNQLFSGLMPQTLLAEEVIAETKTTLATYEASPVFSQIEVEVIEALGKIIGWPEGNRDGVNVPGGSAANFMALHCARQKKFPEFKTKGMNGKPCQVFVSGEAHYSFKKACAVLGMGVENLIQTPVDEKGRMIPSALDHLLKISEEKNCTPLLVCGTSGTTVLGAFDPIDEIADVCRRHDVWLHVDGAWGGPAIFSERLRPLMKGIELADSMTFDAHKLLGAGLPCSFLLTRHKGLLLEANDVSGADYLFHGANSVTDLNADRGKSSWQCGRRADALSFWTLWKSLGTKGLGEFVERLLAVRDQTLAWIQTQSRLRLVGSPDFLNICVRVEPPSPSDNAEDWSRIVRESLKDKNLALVNYSQNSDGPFLRLILAHPRLQLEDVKQILQWALDVSCY